MSRPNRKIKQMQTRGQFCPYKLDDHISVKGLWRKHWGYNWKVPNSCPCLLSNTCLPLDHSSLYERSRLWSKFFNLSISLKSFELSCQMKRVKRSQSIFTYYLSMVYIYITKYLWKVLPITHYTCHYTRSCGSRREALPWRNKYQFSALNRNKIPTKLFPPHGSQWPPSDH